MPVSIFSNNIAMPDRREAIGNAVLDGIGDPPENEQWTVYIYEPQEKPNYIVTIKGPDDFEWERDFFGPEERTPKFIREEVRQATHSP